MKKFLRISFTVISILIITVAVSALGYVANALSATPDPKIGELKNQTFSSIYSEDHAVVEILGKDKEEYVTYDEIPKMLVNALISIEDSNFFVHDGIDYRRTFQALIHNLTSDSKHGGSTITQQLVKNILLSEEQTYKRKIQEAFLAFKLETMLTKKEILEQYFNNVYFEQSIPGVVYASRKYFNKELSQLSIPEFAILAGVVKSASFYNPLKYPDRIEIRKNLVIDRMLELGFISSSEANVAKNIHASTLTVNPDDKSSEKTYRFQAYLDIVYLEATELTGLDPFVDKLEIHTYLDTSLQTYLDDIQAGNVIDFSDDDQQIAATVIRNEDFAIKGVIGGRNYQGSRIFNRAYSMKRQPASTIKPVFSYLLAAEHLDYNSATTIEDNPYTYPGSTFTVQNADHNYLGNLSVLEAIGYSKNTSALFTLGKVGNKLGNTGLKKYLEDIGLMDDGPFTYSYGIGGMSYGVSTTQLAGAYSILTNNGMYKKPSTISLIKKASTGEVLYERNDEKTQVASSESAFIVADTLVQVVKNNYFGIGVIGVNNVQVGAKTGTNGYDSATAARLGYPASADKDTWIAGFSPEYSIAVWTGFDLPTAGKRHYFGSNDNRRRIPKTIFHDVMESISLKNKTLAVPPSLTKVNVVMGAEGYYLPNALIPSTYINPAYFKGNNLPNLVLPLPRYSEIEDMKILIMENEVMLDLVVTEITEEPFDYQKLFGKRGYLFTYITIEGVETTIFSEMPKITLPIDFSLLTAIKVVPTFTDKYEHHGYIHELMLQ